MGICSSCLGGQRQADAYEEVRGRNLRATPGGKGDLLC